MVNQRNIPVVTYAISIICVLIFILLRFTGLENLAESAILLGAYYKPFIIAGEWWRLLTVGFVHIQIFHLLMNVLSFVSLGQSLEGLLGKKKFVITLFLSIIAGSMMQFIWNENIVAVGLSGGLYGLLGMYVYLMVISGVVKQNDVRRSLIRMIGINLIINFMPNVSFQAHLAGLIAGVLCGFIFFPHPKYEKYKRYAIPAIMLYFIILGFLDLQHMTISKDEIYYGTDQNILEKYTEIGLESYSENINAKLYTLYELQ